MKQFFSPESVGKEIGTCSQTIRNWVRLGLVKADAKVNDQFLFSEETLAELKERKAQTNIATSKTALFAA